MFVHINKIIKLLLWRCSLLLFFNIFIAFISAFFKSFLCFEYYFYIIQCMLFNFTINVCLILNLFLSITAIKQVISLSSSSSCSCPYHYTISNYRISDFYFIFIKILSSYYFIRWYSILLQNSIQMILHLLFYLFIHYDFLLILC